MERTKERNIWEVLQSFQIWPERIEKKGKVYKVYSQGRVYACKETSVRKGNKLHALFSFLYYKGFYRFVPVFPANTGQYAVYKDHKLYYLMPWLEGVKRQADSGHTVKMFRELARLHFLTSRDLKIEKERIREHFEKTSLQWKREIAFLDKWIERCEQKWYMSPFEWGFVRYYNEFRNAYHYALYTLEQWKIKIEEERKWRSVLLHGSLSPDHFLTDDQGYGYFINFERSRFGAPYQDLLPFFSEVLRTWPAQHDDCLNWLKSYIKNFPFTDAEMLLFKSYFSQPGYIIRLLNRYETRRVANHELVYSKLLEQEYWRLKNTEYVISRLESQKNKEEGGI